jgi:hypothetical protein
MTHYTHHSNITAAHNVKDELHSEFSAKQEEITSKILPRREIIVNLNHIENRIVLKFQIGFQLWKTQMII